MPEGVLGGEQQTIQNKVPTIFHGQENLDPFHLLTFSVAKRLEFVLHLQVSWSFENPRFTLQSTK